MLVLVTFFSIGVVAVLFLLRFFMALESEAKASRTPAILEVASRRRAASFPITLVHSRSHLALRPNRVAPIEHFQLERKSQFKGA
jgi:hypothetical protein